MAVKRLAGIFGMLLLAAPALAGRSVTSATVAARVTEAGDRPLSGVLVWINQVSGPLAPGFALPRATTDADGACELPVRFLDGADCVVTELFAEKEGHVRTALGSAIPLRKGERHRVALLMERGEELAGELRVPPTPQERAAGMTTGTLRHVFEVSGPGVEGLSLNARIYETEPGGKFSVRLPRGEYTISLLTREEVSWEGVRTGQRDLVLAPRTFEWTEVQVGRVFDSFWETMDAGYSYFFLKKDVDWKALRETCRPLALRARSVDELTSVLVRMLAPLEDLHVGIETPSGWVTPWRKPWSYNGNRRVTLDLLDGVTTCGRNYALVGRTRGEGFGYFLMLNQSQADEAAVREAAEAIRKMRDAPGFLIDLRTANGGSEPLAARIASLFCAEETVYARSRYRNGPGHEDFTQAFDRTLPPSDQPYTKPVVCLIGPGAVSSGEGMVQMLMSLPHVTTVGMPTRGASGNPGVIALGETGISVIYSRWVDLMPDGRTFEGTGIEPDVRVDLPAEAYAAADPTLEKGLELLREKTGARRP